MTGNIRQLFQAKLPLIPVMAFFSGLCGPLFICVMIPLGLWQYREIQGLQLWEAYIATPISEATYDDLCSHDLVPTQIGDCGDSRSVIQLKHIPAIVRANISNDASYSEVNELFGKYLLRCENEADLRHCVYRIDSYYFSVDYANSSNLVRSIQFSSADGNTVMTDISQSTLLLVGTPLMVLALIVSFIPILPGTVIVWLAAMAFGILDQWTQFTPAAGVIVTLITIFSVTSDFWLPLLGMKTGGLTCLGAVGSLIGGFVGTLLIPLPICGTLIGAVGGALVAELLRFRDLRKAFQGGQTAAKMFIIGYIVEAASSIAVFVVYMVSVGRG